MAVALVALGAAGAPTVGQAAWTAMTAVTGPGPASLAEVVAAGAWAAAGLACSWLLLSVALEVVAALPGRMGTIGEHLARRISPVLLRRTVALALGAGLGFGGSAAHAEVVSPGSRAPAALLHLPDPGFAALSTTIAGSEPAGPGPDPALSGAPEPGWVPTRPAVRPQPPMQALEPPVRNADLGEGVVVHRGDSLWSIVAAALGPGATDAEVAAQWPRWHEHNKAVIGPDPDLLRPGQILLAPTEASS